MVPSDAAVLALLGPGDSRGYVPQPNFDRARRRQLFSLATSIHRLHRC